MFIIYLLVRIVYLAFVFGVLVLRLSLALLYLTFVVVLWLTHLVFRKRTP